MKDVSMSTRNADLASLAANAEQAATMLRALANERRLLILCLLIAAGEMSAGELALEVGLSQSALSQHLAKMRAEGLVAFRRESQTLWYRIADPRCERLLATLYELYCKD
jgi:DNA-binding transcriptional ArsR family regulator